MKTGGSFPCPNCGGIVPINATACPDCGSDENTGWSDKTYLDGLGLYDDEDYRETLHREFGLPKQGKRRLTWVWGLFAGILVLVFLLRILLASR
jgi:hypothetical protein